LNYRRHNMTKRPLDHGGEEGDLDRPAARCGKWSVEEENYAEQLIQGFQNGLLEDCNEAESLRSYLCRKLDCKPMRITKKFSGRDIGKLEFEKKGSAAGLHEHLATLRQKFIIASKKKELKRRKRREAAARQQESRQKFDRDRFVDNLLELSYSEAESESEAIPALTQKEEDDLTDDATIESEFSAAAEAVVTPRPSVLVHDLNEIFDADTNHY
jgi:hypothetical protein